MGIRSGQVLRYILVASILNLITSARASRLVNLDSRLSELIAKSPDRNWLVKFYAPSCYYCQLIGPTFEEVSSKLHDSGSNVIVGRVDCTKYSKVCQDFKIPAYPTILFLKNDLVIQYEGDRSAESLTAFARRLEGPDTRTIDSCDQLESLKAQLGLIVLSTLKDSHKSFQQKLLAISKKLKAKYWFYQMSITCKDAQLDQEGLYILKNELNRPIKLSDDLSKIEDTDIVKWLTSNSITVFAELHRMNIDSIISRSNLLVLAVVDLDATNKVFTSQSQKFYDNFRKLAINLAQTSKKVAYGWTSDIELARSIVIDNIPLPSLIFVRPDYSFHLLTDKGQADPKVQSEIGDHSIIQVIKDAHAGKLEFVSTDNLISNCRRNLLKFLRNVQSLYNSNPFLAIFMFGVPTIVISFIIYTFCFMECDSMKGFDADADEDDDDDDDECQHKPRDSDSEGISSESDVSIREEIKLNQRDHHEKQD